MKELEEINEDFSIEIPFDMRVHLILKRGLDIKYDDKTRHILIYKPEKLYFGMPQKEITGIYEGYSARREPSDPILEFVTDEGYRFSLPCSYIYDYKVLDDKDEEI
ncbi:MAG: hypothetical protein QW286_02020 [Candidatus Aenigmatarchaeota archaeon]